MARKKVEEPSGGGSGWLGTFADLMNLLLCFFVLLFSMSSVDADKYEAIVTSLSSSISIFDGGGAAQGEGAFVSSGTDQLVSISEYFNQYEESAKSDDNTDEQSESKASAEGEKNGKLTDSEMRDKVEKEQKAEQKRKTEELYEEVVGKATDKNVVDVVNVNMDAQYQYVQISLKGAILFDSGDATIKKNAIPVLSKIGDILKIYKERLIKIEGHTDNVPISGGRFRNNMELSTSRANSVFEYFVTKKNLNPKKLETAGRGEYLPATSNSSESGRARNRRIEIKIYTTE